MHAAVIIFPGSNCDRDMVTTLHRLTGKPPYTIWHQETALPKKLDFIALPGGFSYGDYLRSGAIAARSPIMKAIQAAARQGIYILGVCNGFQILTEAGLLPGTLLRNQNLTFLCKKVSLQVTNNHSPFTKAYQKKAVITLPIAHHDGNFFVPPQLLKTLQDEDRIAFRYCNPNGHSTLQANPNGSTDHIAGIFSTNKRILGMMPHPERACDPKTGSIDGQKLFLSILENI